MRRHNGERALTFKDRGPLPFCFIIYYILALPYITPIYLRCTVLSDCHVLRLVVEVLSLPPRPEPSVFLCLRFCWLSDAPLCLALLS